MRRSDTVLRDSASSAYSAIYRVGRGAKSIKNKKVNNNKTIVYQPATISEISSDISRQHRRHSGLSGHVHHRASLLAPHVPRSLRRLRYRLRVRRVQVLAEEQFARGNLGILNNTSKYSAVHESSPTTNSRF